MPTSEIIHQSIVHSFTSLTSRHFVSFILWVCIQGRLGRRFIKWIRIQFLRYFWVSIHTFQSWFFDNLRWSELGRHIKCKTRRTLLQYLISSNWDLELVSSQMLPTDLSRITTTNFLLIPKTELMPDAFIWSFEHHFSGLKKLKVSSYIFLLRFWFKNFIFGRSLLDTV